MLSTAPSSPPLGADMAPPPPEVGLHVSVTSGPHMGSAPGLGRGPDPPPPDTHGLSQTWSEPVLPDPHYDIWHLHPSALITCLSVTDGTAAWYSSPLTRADCRSSWQFRSSAVKATRCNMTVSADLGLHDRFYPPLTSDLDLQCWLARIQTHWRLPQD
jgi:hypothetical protein